MKIVIHVITFLVLITLFYLTPPPTFAIVFQEDTCSPAGGRCRSSCAGGTIDTNQTCSSIRQSCCMPTSSFGAAPCYVTIRDDAYFACPVGYNYACDQCVPNSGCGSGGCLGCAPGYHANCQGACVANLRDIPCGGSGGGGGGGGGGAPAPPTPRYNIAGYVWRDENANGVDDGESNFAGATVTLSGRASGTRTTTSGGNFAFNGFLPGSYTVRVTVPANYRATTANPRGISIGPSRTNINFGIAPLYNISGTVFVDTNRNGVRDGGEGVAPGVWIDLTGRANGGAPTNGSGNYAMNGFLGGAYALTVRIPTGFVNTTPVRQNITIGPNRTGVNFGIVQTYSIGGEVFNDVNKNRIKDSTSGVPEQNILSGITITSSGGSLFTNSGSGQYIVNNLFAGTYTISYTSSPPAGYFMIYPLNGPPPQHRVTVGPNCTRDINLSFGASCSGGNVNNANFAVSNSIPWMQSYGFNMRLDEGFEDKIPTSPLYPPYASVADNINEVN